MKKGETGLSKILTPEMIKSYSAKGMTIKEIASLFGYTDRRISQIIGDSDELKAAFEEGHALLADTLTSALMKLISGDKPNVIAVLFALKSRCGWIEEQHRQKDREVTNQSMVTVYLPDNNRDVVNFETVQIEKNALEFVN